MCTLSPYTHTYTGMDTESYRNVDKYHLPQMSDELSHVRKT